MTWHSCILVYHFQNYKTFRNPFIEKAGVFYWITNNRPSNFVFKGGLFQNRYNHKGQVKYSSYRQYINVFYNPSKPSFVSVTAFLVNLFYIINIVIHIKNIVFLQFLQRKKGKYWNIQGKMVSIDSRFRGNDRMGKLE